MYLTTLLNPLPVLISFVNPLLVLAVLVKVIPEFCIAHPYCARFLHHQREHMSARAYKT